MNADSRKAIFAWSMYDWANSAFATAIMAGFFPVFLSEFWSPGANQTVITARLSMANSIASIVVALLAPILGAIADKGTAKKKFLMFFAYMGLVMTSALYLVSKGNWPVAVLLYIFACIGFSGGNIFYDSLLTGVASEKKRDLVSSLGYSLGYLGGGLLFAINVLMVVFHETFGFSSDTEAVKFTFLSVGIWWAVFSVPIFLFVKEPEYGKSESGLKMVKAGYTQFKETFQEIRHLKTIFLFLLAYWLYIDGVDTVVRMALRYGQSIGFERNHLIVAILITQFVGFPCAIGFGYLAGKIGAKRAIFIGIAAYVFVCIWAAFMQNVKEFYILAAVVGIFQGGIQALSRSFYAGIIPVNKSAEYFGFYNMLGKFAAVIGPVIMGGVGMLIVAMGYSENFALRVSITSIVILFIAGGVLFYFVDEARGREEIKYLS